jgi:PEP-CTERM motif
MAQRSRLERLEGGASDCREEESQGGDLIGPLDWHRILPFAPAVASDRLERVGLEAARFQASPAADFNHPALTHHMLVLFTRPPDELDLRDEGVKRHVPPPSGSISLVPAGSPVRVRMSECRDQLHIFLEPGVVGRVAAEGVRPRPDARVGPPARRPGPATAAGGDGGGGRRADHRRRRRAAGRRVLANVLAVPLIRHVLAPRRGARGRDRGNVPLGPSESGAIDIIVMDDFLYSEPAAVPEPTTLLLFSTALTGLGLAWWRRRGGSLK